MKNPSRKWSSDTLQLPIGIVLVIAILYLAKVVIVPIVTAILLTFILTPLVIFLHRYGIKRTYGVVLTVFLAISLFGLVSYLVGSQLHSLASGLPNHRKEIEAKIASIRDGGGVFADALKMFREISRADSETNPNSDEKTSNDRDVVVVRTEEPGSIEKVFQSVGPVLEPLAQTGFVIILVIFMLFHREDLRNRFIGLLGDGRLTGTTRVIVDSAQRLSRYLLTLSLINLIFGILFALGLYFLNVEYAILWGLVTAMMRFIPYIGTWLSVLLPLALSFATSPTWAQPIAVLAYFAVLDLFAANVVEPLLLGRRTGVSPVALLVAAAFWTWLWGPLGLMLSTPLTVCMVVIGQHVPQFRFFALLLSDQPPLQPQTQYYQRLLARDMDEAKDLVLDYSVTVGFDQVYDEVLLPALIMARRDRKDAGLEAEDESYIIKTTQELAALVESSKLELKKTEVSLKEERRLEENSNTVNSFDQSQNENEKSSPFLVIGCPAHIQAEELSLQMLSSLIKPIGGEIEILSTRTLAAEIESRIEQTNPSLVLISILPPGGLVQARYLCKRIRKRFEDLSIIVGYWGEVNNFDKLFRQIRSAGGNYVATSLAQAKSQVEALVHPSTLKEQKLESQSFVNVC